MFLCIPTHVRRKTVCLRMQIDPSNKDFTGISPERAFADYVLANAILFLAVFNYMG
jgi:oligosaccharyltransferase complex subunit epsilon